MNIIIKSSDWIEGDQILVFGDWDCELNEEVIFVESTNFTDLMIELGIYASKNHAKRDGRVGNIPLGYSEYRASKKVKLYIWNPCNNIDWKDGVPYDRSKR